jgi:hypothetical protein
MKSISAVLLIFLALNLGMLCGSVQSFHPVVKMVKRSAPIAVSLSLYGISSIGQEGEVVFLVSSTERAPNTEAKILLPEGFSKVAGTLSWTGDIAAGETIVIRAKVKAEKVGDWTIEGQAISKTNGGGTFGKSSCLHVSISQDAVVTNEVDPVTGTNEESICLLDERGRLSGGSEVSPMSPGTVTVYGWWYFYEEDSETLRPLRHVKVELWDSDLGGLINYLLATTYTDDNGYYQFPPINNDDGFLEDGFDVFVKEYSDNSIVKVTDDAGNLYWGQTGVDSNVPDGLHNMGSWAVTGDNRGNKAILDTIEIGHEYASSLGYNHVKVEVRWPSDGTYVPLDDPLTIHFLSGDEWDEDVILHEYGHTIQHSIYGEWIPNSGGSHTWNQHTNPNFAFSEGWQTFFAVATNFEMGYGDSLYPRDSWYRDHVDIIINHDLETDNHAYGVDVEGAVACLLWDVFDSSEDVLAHGTDSLSAGMSPIWDVFENYLTGGHHVYDIYSQFWEGWFNRGHNHYQVMWDIYYHHCISVGGCPYIYTWDGQQYVMDNNLLPASEMSNGADVEDRYMLEQPLVPMYQVTRRSVYSLQIREFEHEHDYFDQVKLLAVDHNSNVNVAVSPYGEILTYSNPAPAIFAVDDNGVDVLSLLSSVDGNYYEGYNGSYIILNFGNVNSENAKLVLRTDAYLVKDSIHIQVQNENGQWKDVASVIPRAYWSTDIIDMSNYLPDANDNLKVRLYFTANHKIDYVGLDTTPQASVKTYEANLTSAIHSTQGNVKPLLMKNDQTYAELTPRQQIQLTFLLPNNQNQERTFILYAEGHYSTIAP